jgi:hypothetical protein
MGRLGYLLGRIAALVGLACRPRRALLTFLEA